MLRFRGKVCHNEDCALLVALIVTKGAFRFYMKFFWVLP